MKEIKIEKLTLNRFKGCAHFELDLGGRDAAVFGDNAAGKTTIYDALTWLLFGKDSRGSADQEIIKPLDREGNVADHEAVTTVEAVLTVCEDGRPVTAPTTLRKEMQEAWVTRRGSSQPVYDGNEFRYFVDDVPMKKNEFSSRVGELVDEETFRILTSVTGFAQDMPWKKRREILYDMSGAADLSDRALLQKAAQDNDSDLDADTRQRFGKLADAMEGKSLDDLRKVLQQKRKNLVGARDQTPARIDEMAAQETKLAALDFDGARVTLDGVRQELAVLRAEIAKETAASGQQGAVSARKITETEIALRELETEKDRYAAKWLADRAAIEKRGLLLDRENDAFARNLLEQAEPLRRELADLEAKNQAFRQEQRSALPNLNDMQRTVDALAANARRFEETAKDAECEAEKWDALVEANRKEWLEANKAAFTGGNCPTCGQALPMEMLSEAKTRFEREKNRTLGDIQRRAEINRENADRCRQKVLEAREKANLTNQTLDKALTELEAASKAPVEIRDLDGYAARKLELEHTLTELTGASRVMPGYQEKEAEIRAELAAHDAKQEMPGYPERRAALEAALAEEREQDAREAREKAQREAEARERVAALQEKERLLLGREKEAYDILGQKITLDATRKRIQELREEQKQAGAELERTDAFLWTIEAFIRWKTHFVEDSINGLFRLVTFRLFREQANGGLEERCDVVVNGVPYSALNNGMRINAGLDIIRRLAEHYKVRVPLFVDNAESVTRLEDAGTQVIRLVVSEKDQSLRVETE